MRLVRVAVLILLLPVAALAGEREEDAEAEIRSAIARWYEELALKEDGRVDLVVGRPFFEASQYYYHVNNGSAALGPRVYSSLAATALKFEYDVEFLRIDPNFARAAVWERAYFYAPAFDRTTERHADSDFILERRESDGQWRIVAYRTGFYGIPPGKKTDPMPDLRDLYYRTTGETPAADGE